MLPVVLRAAFEHPWIGSYQIGFGPPLVRSSDHLIHRLAETRSAIDKLETYLHVCVLDREECTRLAAIHRRLLVRRHGPIEAEELDAASTEALDLSLRLHVPTDAPTNARVEMLASGVRFDAPPPGTVPELLTGRFLVRLSDPRNERLLHRQDVASLGTRAGFDVSESALVLELRVPIASADFWEVWVQNFSRKAPAYGIRLGELSSHARTTRDGAHS